MTNLLEEAARLIEGGLEPERTATSSGGRPLVRFEVGDIILTPKEMDRVNQMVIRKDTSLPKISTQEELIAFCRTGVPSLIQRAHHLAMHSDDIRAIMLVAKELTDRAYGKSVQGVVVHMGDDIQAAWKELGVIDDGGVIDETGAKDGEVADAQVN